MKSPVVRSASPWGMEFNYPSLKITRLMWLLQKSLGEQTEARTHQRRVANSAREVRVDAAFLPRLASWLQHFPRETLTFMDCLSQTSNSNIIAQRTQDNSQLKSILQDTRSTLFPTAKKIKTMGNLSHQSEVELKERWQGPRAVS